MLSLPPTRLLPPPHLLLVWLVGSPLVARPSTSAAPVLLGLRLLLPWVPVRLCAALRLAITPAPYPAISGDLALNL